MPRDFSCGFHRKLYCKCIQAMSSCKHFFKCLAQCNSSNTCEKLYTGTYLNSLKMILIIFRVRDVSQILRPKWGQRKKEGDKDGLINWMRRSLSLTWWKNADCWQCEPTACHQNLRKLILISHPRTFSAEWDILS